MALSRIGYSNDLAVLFARSSFAASNSSHRRSNAEHLHGTTIRQYPEAPRLAFPTNVSEILNIETARFAPERARDIAAPIFLNNKLSSSNNSGANFTKGYDRSVKMQQLDSRHDSYDCFGAVSLSGSMQTNVPKPSCGGNRSTYLNMPGGMWARDGKYIADIMNSNHFKMDQMRHVKRYGGLDGLVTRNHQKNTNAMRCYSTATATNPTSSAAQEDKKVNSDQKAEPSKKPQPLNLSRRERLNLVIKDYGKTVIFFHIGISLISLGGFYTMVSSGLDVKPIINFIAGAYVEEKESQEMANKILGEGSTFLIAYGVHKLFAPVRLSLTLACTPIIVRALRQRGWLKPPAKIVKPS